jgi:hypothetical protein
MELAIVLILLVALDVAAILGGADSRPRIDDDPRAAI